MGTLRTIVVGLLALVLSVSAALADGPSSMQSSPVYDTVTLSGGTEVLLANQAGGSGTYNLLTGVPAYDWYHGCGPTAVGSIMGYYDLKGYSNLFDAAGWDEVSLTANVQDQISSPEHNAKYDPHPDNATLPTPPNTSIACWFQTSVNQPYGWSYLNRSDDAFKGYVQSKGYQCSSAYFQCSVISGWDKLVEEVDLGNPLMFLVDTDGNGSTDHFIPVFGYDDRGAEGKFYACYTTWTESETVQWYEFQSMGNDWGVGYITWAHLTPEPGTVALLAIGACMGLLRTKRR